MKFKKIPLVIAFHTIIIGGIAIAAPIKPMSDMGTPYLTVQLGYGAIDTGAINGLHKKDGGLAYRLSGGYLFKLTNQLELGPEIGYSVYPKTEYTAHIGDDSGDIKYTSYSLDILADARYYFSSQLFGIGKLGFGSVTQNLDVSENHATLLDETENKILPKASLGLGYVINKQVSLSASVDYSFGGANSTDFSSQAEAEKVVNVHTYMLGFSYSFH